MKCKKHPKYQGKISPRVPCEDCWRVYFNNKDKKYRLDIDDDGHWYLIESKNYQEYLRLLEATYTDGTTLDEDKRFDEIARRLDMHPSNYEITGEPKEINSHS